MKQYVVGFLYSKYEHVLLIRKNKPDWQKGRWNGVGGKVESTDASALEAMIREFKEETDIDFAGWKYSGFMSGQNSDGPWRVFMYRGRMNDDHPPMPKLVGPDEEQAEWKALEEIQELNTICNLKYLVPMLYYFEGSELAMVELKYEEFDDR